MVRTAIKRIKESLMRPQRSIDLYMSPLALQKQQALVDACDGEVGWFGLVDKIEINDDGFIRNVDRVYDLLVPEQEVSAAHVDHNGFDLNEFLEEFEAVAHEMKFYGHSHVRMPPRPSWIDLDQIDTWEEYGLPYLYSHIQNKYGEMYTRMDQWEPRRVITPVEIKIEPSEEAINWAAATRMEVVHHLTKEEFDRRYKVIND